MASAPQPRSQPWRRSPGSPTHGIGITVWTGVPEGRFKSQFGSLGSPVSLGSFAVAKQI